MKSTVKEKITLFRWENKQYEEVEKTQKTLKEWKQILSPAIFKITRKKITERPYTGEYWDNFQKGLYVCICCGNDLFPSETKYNAGTGWPSFYAPIDEHNIQYREDNTLFSKKKEVLCRKCDAHLGHVFQDGPSPTYKRFSINSRALYFQPSKI